NFEEDDIRIDYSSLARPNTTYSYDFNSDKLTILKNHEIPSGFNPEEYKVERIFADNEDVKVPITLFYKKSLFKKDGSNPLYLMGYGAYGIAMPVNFRNTAVTLADRGFIYAVAHIRGGDDLGHDWYEAAKFLTKKRTFEDFIACSRALINEQYTSNNNIVIMGGSAGGMLIGYVLNEKPEIYRAAIVHVPFVDVLSTMLDESLPLTLLEYNEWGNPKEKEYFEYIKSYSPYDNVKAQNYPALFVTCGISDPRVGYWEPAKWVAKLRELKMDNNPLLLKTNMDTGHKGSAGRVDYLKEIADELVFILKVFDVGV
ncbi:MAG: prolyl oligopeptidase family serine peptidase, partial [Rickettsia conorii subsp. raoultii]|uniref:prolyl oligopeptidase family serine peptidase n=1 Tax=Rickettsia conorii TaxID=781 RepID=UPI003AF0F709